MKKYIILDKEYMAQDVNELLTKVKNKNGHTSYMSTQEYIDNVAAEMINSMTDHKVEVPAKPEDICKTWQKMGILREVN